MRIDKVTLELSDVINFLNSTRQLKGFGEKYEKESQNIGGKLLGSGFQVDAVVKVNYYPEDAELELAEHWDNSIEFKVVHELHDIEETAVSEDLYYEIERVAKGLR